MNYDQAIKTVIRISDQYRKKMSTLKNVKPMMRELKEELAGIVDLSGWIFTHNIVMTKGWVKSVKGDTLFEFEKQEDNHFKIILVFKGWDAILPTDEQLFKITAKQHTLNVLKKVTEAIENEDWKALEQLTERSAAGDGYGDDNIYIDFTPHTDSDHWNERYDISDMESMIRNGYEFNVTEEEK